MIDGSPVKGLSHLAAQASGAWVPKIVTTDAPKYMPHIEYALAWTLDCSVPVLPVMMLITGQHGRYFRPWRHSGRQCWSIRLSFFPDDWKTSNKVCVNLEGLQVEVQDAVLKQDPRMCVKTDLLGSSCSIETGRVITLASVNVKTTVNASLLLVAKSDTEAKRGRWALKPAAIASLPEKLSFLARGRTTDTF